MAYYTTLINEWATITTANPGFTTAQKLSAINALTVTGSIPTLFYVTGAQILSCLNFAEFATLTAAQQSVILQICALPGPIPAGSSLPFVSALLANYYTGKLGGPTITAMTALAQGSVQPWWQANGYTSPIAPSDLAAAGGLT